MKTWAVERERALFVHIPKTGGMTLRSALCSQYRFEDAAPAVDWAGLGRLPQPLDSYKLFAGHFRYFVRRLLPDETKVFTFLRDPVERTISHLKHLATDPQFHPLYELAHGRELRALAQDQRIMSQCSNVQVGYLCGARPELTDADLATFPDEDECCYDPEGLDSALSALQAMEFVGFVDDIDDDFARLCEVLHLHPSTGLPRINTATERAEISSEDAELREIVAQANHLDCELYAEAKKRWANRMPLADRNARITDLIEKGTYPVIDSSMIFPMSGPIPGTGFWMQEGEAPDMFRWTGPENALCLELPLAPGRAFTLQLAIRQRLDIGELSAFVDDAPVAVHRTQTGEFSARLQIDIPSQRSFLLTCVKIVAEHMRRPNIGDPRLLGFVMVDFNLIELCHTV